MKIGIIIIFHNNEKEIKKDFFIEQIKQTNNIELCFVNNDSRDNTYSVLKDIKEQCNNVSLIDIKKFKSDVSAVRAGARYMFNKYDLEYLGYITTNLLNTRIHGLNGMIKAITENQKLILEYKTRSFRRANIKLTLFQQLFSIIDYLKKIKVDNQFVKIQYSSKL